MQNGKKKSYTFMFVYIQTINFGRLWKTATMKCACVSLYKFRSTCLVIIKSKEREKHIKFLDAEQNTNQKKKKKTRINYQIMLKIFGCGSNFQNMPAASKEILNISQKPKNNQHFSLSQNMMNYGLFFSVSLIRYAYNMFIRWIYYRRCILLSNAWTKKKRFFRILTVIVHVFIHCLINIYRDQHTYYVRFKMMAVTAWKVLFHTVCIMVLRAWYLCDGGWNKFKLWWE